MTTLSFSTGEFACKTIRKLTSITEQMSLLSVKNPRCFFTVFSKTDESLYDYDIGYHHIIHNILIPGFFFLHFICFFCGNYDKIQMIQKLFHP